MTRTVRILTLHASHIGGGQVSAIALVAFVILVAYVAATKRDIQPRRSPHPEFAEAV
jgi:hypothetical protein